LITKIALFSAFFTVLGRFLLDILGWSVSLASNKRIQPTSG
jgi:hypothetical protein